VRIRQGFLCGEGFGGNEEEGGGGAANTESFHQVGRIDIGDKMKTKVSTMVLQMRDLKMMGILMMVTSMMVPSMKVSMTKVSMKV
jgi:hypothetical protein